MKNQKLSKSTIAIVLVFLIFLSFSFNSWQFYFQSNNARTSAIGSIKSHQYIKNASMKDTNGTYESSNNLTRRQAIINFIAGLQLPAGGFVMWLDSSEEEEGIAQAVDAIKTLVPLNGLSAINREKLIEFVAKRQLSSGGFVSTLNYSGEIPEIADAYDAAYILAHLNAFDVINKTAFLNWILSCYHPEDGRFTIYSKNEKPEAYKDDFWVFHTVVGVLALYWMKELDKINLEKSIEYILSQYQSDGGFKGSPLSKESDYSDTLWCIRALYRLGALDRINREKTINYILQFYNATSQTFIAPGPPITSAYRGTVILGMLHATDRINTTKLINLILSCQSNLHGGFIPTPDKNDTRYKESIEVTRLAVDMLTALNALDRLNEPFAVLYTPAWYGKPYIPRNNGNSVANHNNSGSLDPVAVAVNLLFVGIAIIFLTVVYDRHKRKKKLKKLKRLKASSRYKR